MYRRTNKRYSILFYSARLCSLAGRYDNPIPIRFLAPIDCLKIPALITISIPYPIPHRGGGVCHRKRIGRGSQVKMISGIPTVNST